jgi:hypothetical protein
LLVRQRIELGSCPEAKLLEAGTLSSQPMSNRAGAQLFREGAQANDVLLPPELLDAIDKHRYRCAKPFPAVPSGGCPHGSTCLGKRLAKGTIGLQRCLDRPIDLGSRDLTRFGEPIDHGSQAVGRGAKLLF